VVFDGKKYDTLVSYDVQDQVVVDDELPKIVSLFQILL
jgi:hypothetical protein